MVDKILNLEILETSANTNSELNEMLVNRFQYKIMQKLEGKSTSAEFIKYKKFIQKMEKHLPSEIYQEIINIINKAIVVDTDLADCEAQIIKIIESTKEKPLSFIPFEQLDSISLESLANLKFDDGVKIKNTKEFYEKNPDCKIPGGYFKKISTLFKEMFKEKLELQAEDKLEVQNILNYCLKNVLLPREAKWNVEGLKKELEGISDIGEQATLSGNQDHSNDIV